MKREAPSTYIGPEERAYNTYSGGHSRSGRKGRARYPDGQIRSVTLGVADTFFSIPAHGQVKGRYVSGCVTHSECDSEYDGPNGEFRFHISAPQEPCAS